MRTTQNEASSEKPKNAAFISDRNTKASATKAADPTATSPMPTTEGLKFQMNELANRDYRDGDIKEDAAKKSAAAPKTQPTPQKPQPTAAASPPAPPTPPPAPPPQAIASAPTSSPLAKMMEEADKDLARVDMNRLPLEVRKPEPQKQQPDAPPPSPPKPQMREVADSPPVPKAVPVSEDVLKTTSNPKDKAFMPFTRTSENKGTLSNRGAEDSVDAEDTAKGRYIREVNSQVERKWHLFRALRRDMVTPGNLKLEFYINAKGKVENLRIVDGAESTTLLSEFTVRAIREAEIPPMPKEVQELLPIMDKQRLKMVYNVLIY